MKKCGRRGGKRSVLLGKYELLPQKVNPKTRTRECTILGWDGRERGRDCSLHTFTTELYPGEMEPRKGGVDGLTRIKWCVEKVSWKPIY